MSYDLNKLVKLKALKTLAEKINSDFAKGADLNALGARVTAIETIDPEKNVIVGVQKNGADLTPDANRKVNLVVPTKTSDLTNDSAFIGEQAIDDKISAAVSGALQPAGSVAFANLPQLAKANCNKIYNVTDAFTTTSDFVEGAGKSYPAGTNVAIINVGTAGTPSYKYDCYTGVIDLSGYMEKKTTATSGNFATFDANGQVVDSSTKPSDFLTSHQDISGKADKDTDAVSGNFAMFDANGNPIDSGHKHSDYLTAHQDISGKADKVTGATNGNFAGLDANGNLTDSGKKAADFVAAESGKRLMTDAEGTKLSGISTGATKVESSTTNGNIKIDGVETTVYTGPDVATDAEVTEMIGEVFGD